MMKQNNWQQKSFLGVVKDHNFHTENGNNCRRSHGNHVEKNQIQTLTFAVRKIIG